jgi:hypothetical protein
MCIFPVAGTKSSLGLIIAPIVLCAVSFFHGFDKRLNAQSVWPSVTSFGNERQPSSFGLTHQFNEPSTISENESYSPPSDYSNLQTKDFLAKSSVEIDLDQPLPALGTEKSDPILSPRILLGRKLLTDQRNFYSMDSMLGLTAAFGLGAIAANTSFDQQVHKHFQSSIRGASSDVWFDSLHANKELGNGIYSLPIMGSAWLLSAAMPQVEEFEVAGTWGERSLRSFVVGAPPLILMQRVTGGSRPFETTENAEWHPFRDNNGVSGHAFMSSLPFITAAKMTKNPWGKSAWYAASTLGPLSRVNDNAHYPSQIALGWILAYAAATSVDRTDTGKKGWHLLSETADGRPGMSVQYRW